MAKKKKKNNTPNIPQEVLDRAREQVNEEASENDTPESAEDARRAAERRAERAARRAARRQQVTTGEKPKARDELGSGVVAEMLANPTTKVTEDDLRVQYGYVLADLKNMGILAGILFVVLIALGFLL